MLNPTPTEFAREHEVGQLAAPLLKFDLPQEIEWLQKEGRWQGGHTAKTLVKYPNLRIVLITMHPGGEIAEHHTDGRISVHVLSGKINFVAEGKPVVLCSGQMLSLEQGITHRVQGLTESAFLLTVARPQAQDLNGSSKG